MIIGAVEGYKRRGPSILSGGSEKIQERFFFPFGILALQLGIESMPPEVELQSLNHWTTKEVPGKVS